MRSGRSPLLAANGGRRPERSEVLRVVLDTNVIVSGLIASSGGPFDVLEAHRRGEFILLVSELILDEVEQVLARPFFRQKRSITPDVVAAVIRLLRGDAVIVNPQTRLVVVAHDPDDDRILECALEGSADYLVTGDHHLLALRRYRDLAIVSPADLLARLEAGRQPR